MTDGPISVTMLFQFDAEGLITTVCVEGRTATVGTVTEMMPWECRMSNYQTRDGIRVPLTGEAVYIAHEEEKSDFKGDIDTLDFEFAP